MVGKLSVIAWAAMHFEGCSCLGCGEPLERGSEPRIGFEFSPFRCERRHEIPQEQKLCGGEHDGGIGDELLDGEKLCDVRGGADELCVAAGVASESELVHGHEDCVSSKECQPEVPAA